MKKAAPKSAVGVDPRGRMSNRTANSRNGFTIVELLTVIAIIGLLVSLIMPAVQAARESSRRIACQNNLRQLGIAVHTHHETWKTFPKSVSPFKEGPRPRPQRDGRGWIVAILPYLEQRALYEQFASVFDTDFLSGFGLKDPAALPAMQTQLTVLHCPSESSVLDLSDNQWQWETIPVALTSYKGVIGDNRMGGSWSMHAGSEPDCIKTGKCNGIFFRLTYQRPVRMGDVRDGASNTFMIGEDVPEQNAHSVAFYANGDYASCHAPLNFFFYPPRPREWWDVMSFRSYHPGGASFCLADGSVRFVSDAIEHKLYRALSTRNGREIAAVP